MAKPTEPIARKETILFCHLCGRRMKVYATQNQDAMTVRYWKCPACKRKITGKTVETTRTYRRH